MQRGSEKRSNYLTVEMKVRGEVFPAENLEIELAKTEERCIKRLPSDETLEKV